MRRVARTLAAWAHVSDDTAYRRMRGGVALAVTDRALATVARKAGLLPRVLRWREALDNWPEPSWESTATAEPVAELGREIDDRIEDDRGEQP